jgi:transcriptional regulator with XRE-family HTH domain
MTFAEELTRLREERGVQKMRMAAAAGLDHSSVSRLESGERSPTRETVLQLAAGLELDQAERDRLLIAAGFVPERPESLVAAEPACRDLYAFLTDQAVSESRRQAIRDAVRALLTAVQTE